MSSTLSLLTQLACLNLLLMAVDDLYLTNTELPYTVLALTPLGLEAVDQFNHAMEQ